MRLALVRHLWGVDLTGGYGGHARHWRDVGYESVEGSIRLVPDRAAFVEFLRGGEFGWIPQVFSNMFAGGGSVEKHLASLREQVEECLPYGPEFFNGQTGSDHWCEKEAEDFFGAALAMEKELGIRLCHETHRSRYFGDPWRTVRLLGRLPALKLTCDFSHWVCVAERLLGDVGAEVRLAASRCFHVHARVGYEEGPQVPDPRDPRWAGQVGAHRQWWEWAWQAGCERGDAVSTLTPEFGPPPYLQVAPFTGEPASDLEEVCDWMALQEREHYIRWSREGCGNGNAADGGPEAYVRRTSEFTAG